MRFFRCWKGQCSSVCARRRRRRCGRVRIGVRVLLAAESGLSAKQIRDYEKHGLIAPAARSEAGYRCYGQADLSKRASGLFADIGPECRSRIGRKGCHSGSCYAGLIWTRPTWLPPVRRRNTPRLLRHPPPSTDPPPRPPALRRLPLRRPRPRWRRLRRTGRSPPITTTRTSCLPR